MQSIDERFVTKHIMGSQLSMSFSAHASVADSAVGCTVEVMVTTVSRNIVKLSV